MLVVVGMTEEITATEHAAADPFRDPSAYSEAEQQHTLEVGQHASLTINSDSLVILGTWTPWIRAHTLAMRNHSQ